MSLFSGSTLAQTEKMPDDEARRLFYMIYDSSNSMWGELSDKSRKYEAGRTAMSSVLDLNLEDRDLAFRAYGHRDKTDCRDSELIVNATDSTTAKPLINKAVTNIRPTGKTPITHSLREALKDMGNRKGDILLISDGIETCDIDPCALMAEWRNQGIKIRVHVVGVGLNEIERKAMMCVADTGGGKYFDAGSEAELIKAMNAASKIELGTPELVKQVRGYGLNIQGLDETGRSFVIIGKLYKDGVEIMDLSSNGQHWLDDGPGDYTMTVGVVLKDGSIYKPVTQDVKIDTVGSKRVDVLITRPAIVSAKFSEDGEEHRGAHVYAYQDGKQIFGFRRFDEALAGPGSYEFRSKPNDDNELKVEATLTEGEHTIVDYKLVNTVKVQFKYVLPNGETAQRGGQLYQNEEVVYNTYTNRATGVKPGIYELRDKFKNVLNPMTPREVTITTDEEQIIEIQMQAGYITTEYAGADRDYIKRKGGYTYIHALDADGKSIGSKTASPGTIDVAKPGRYRVLGHSGKGYFDPVEITVENNKTVNVSIVAKPTAHISMTYASGTYKRTPDRASLIPLDGQKPIKTFMRPDKVLKVPPGRYYIMPHSYTPEAKDTPEFALKTGETRAIVIPRK
ncbi:MAG: hypothetical protein JKX72_03885 [Robiginitomaculum sp.]|nr:hypothetical protein [Robiginitomaculum sp.]